MPLDSRIILGAGVGVQQIDTPLQIEAKRAALAQVRQKAQDDQQARAADNAFRQALQATGGDYDAAIQQSEQQGFNMLPIREAIQKQRNTILDGVKKGLDNEKLSSDLLSRLMQNVHSQQDWQTIAPLAARIDPEFVQHAGSTYDQQRFDAFRNIGVDADKQFEAVQKAHEDYNAGKGEEGFRKSLLATQDDEDLAGAIQVAKGWGVGDAVIRKYLPQGAKWSPEIPQRAASLSITPEKQAELAGKATDDARMAAAQAETARHNRVEEGVSGGNLRLRGAELQRQIAKDKTEATVAAEVTKLPAAVAEKVAGVEQSLSVLSDLQKMIDDPKSGMKARIGPTGGYMLDARVSTPGVSVDPSLARFSAQTATLKNATVKAITGAQMSEPEAKRIMAQVPTMYDKPEVWAQKAATTKENLSLLRQRLLQLSGVNVEAAKPSESGKRFQILSVK